MKSGTRDIFIIVLLLKLIVFSIFIVLLIDMGTVFSGTKEQVAEPEKIVETGEALPAAVSDDDRANLDWLIQKKAELQAREEAIAKERAELDAIRNDISTEFDKLSQLRNEIKAELAQKELVDGRKLQQLVKVYSAMKPQNAASLIEKLDQKLAIDLLVSMKGEIVGNILSCMEKDKAAKMIEGIANR